MKKCSCGNADRADFLRKHCPNCGGSGWTSFPLTAAELPLPERKSTPTNAVGMRPREPVPA